MSVYERYQRMKTEGSYSPTNSSSTVYERYRKMRIEDAFSTTDFSNPNSLEYWIGAANNFVNDLDDYYSNNSQKYDVNFGSSLDSQFESAFRTGEAALDYLEKNKDTIHGYYDLKKGIQSYLDAFNTAKESVSGVRDYYSQWETEDDYNAYTEAQNMLNPTSFSLDDIEGRNARIKEIDSRLAELRAGYVNTPTSNEDPWISNHTSIIDNGKAADVISEEQKLLAEKKTLELANRQYKRTQEWADENAKIRQNEDFAEDSQKRDFTNPTRQELSEYDTRMSGGFTPDENNVLYDVYGDVYDDTYYDRFKAPEVTDKLGLYLSSSEEDIEDAYSSDASFQEQTWANLIKEGDAQSWKYLKPEEIDIYYYFLNNGGQEQAYKWLDGMTTELNRREMEKSAENFQKNYDEASTLEKIGMSAASIPASVFGGALSFISDLGYYIRGEELNPYDTAHSFQDYSQNVRSATAEEINELTNNANLLGFTWGDAYQSVMSAGDSAVGTLLGGNAYGTLMGMGAASTKARELYEKGASMEDIAWGGVLAGAAEMVFEKYSIDKLVSLKNAKTLGQVVKNLLSQGGVEASEEVFTEIANTISDGIIMGEQSDLNKKAVEEYMSQGMSRAKAQALALASNVWKAGMGGFISGALMGGGASATQAIANRPGVKAEGEAIIKTGGVDALKELALEVAGASKGGDSRYTKRLAETTDKKQSARNVGLLSSAVTDLVATQNVADIENTLRENGMSKKEAKETAQYLKAASEGEVLTEEQQKALMDNKVVSKVYGDVIMDSNSTYNKRRQALMGIGTMEEGFAGVDTKALEESQTPESITKNIANRIAQERAIEQAVKNGMKKPSAELLSQIEGIKAAQSSVIPERNFKDMGQLDTARMNEALKGAKVANVDGKVTDNGATFRKSTGEEVSIKKIASIDTKHKTMELELEDGTKVDSRDISYGDRNQALLYESVLMMGYDAHTANAIIQGYDPNGTVSVSDYLIGTNEAFNYGWGHIPEKARGGAGYKALTKSQREHAVKVGEDARAADDKQRKANMPNKQNALAKKKRTYGATLEVEKDYVPDRVKASIEGLDVVGKKLNLRFVIKDLGGKSNGYYRESEDVIIVDINAGRNGQHTLLWTASHELGHRLRAWNVDKFNTLADFLMERYAEEGKDIDELIRIEQEKAIKASKGKDKLTYDEAYEEVVCQALQGFLTDSNFIAELTELQKKDATLAEKLISFLKDILDKIRNAYKGLSPSDKATAYLKEMGDTADKLYKMLSEGLMETADTVVAGDANAAITVESDGTIKAQLKQYDDTGRDALYNYMKDNYSEKEADELIGTVDLIANTVRDLKKDKSLSVFGNWQEQEVELDEEGHPIFTTNITNGDYSLNQDFSRVCKKRRQLDFVLNMLAEDPAFEASNLTKEDFVAINNAIKEHGFEIACALCFVDAKRFRQAEWADSYANTYNDILQSVTKQKLTPFNFATKNPNMADDNIEIDLNAPVSFRKWSDGKVTATRKYKNLNELIAKEGNNQVKAMARMIKNNPNYRHLFRGADIVASQGFDTIQRLAPDIRATLDGWGGTSVPKPSSSDAIYDNSILNIAGYNAESAFAVGGVRMNSFSDFMGHMFFDYVQAFADLTAKKLPMQSYTKELDFARLFGLTGGKINMSLIAKIREGALSLEGLSESSQKYKNIKAAEQRVAGLDITKLTEKLGKSVMELTNEDVLNNLDLVDYLWADESIDYKKAVLLQSGILYDNLTDEQIDKCVDLIRKKEIKQAHKVAGAKNVDTRYAKHIGTICVGVSDAHILKLLRDDTIRMVIPYHKSGLNGAIAKALNIAYYVDYSSSQTTGLCILQEDGTYASRIGLNGASAAEKGYKIKDFSFYDYFGKTIDGVTYDAKKTAAKYKEWCEYGVYDEDAGCNVYYLKSGGYITAEELHKTAKIVPKFEQFSNEENYYKVLEDFDCYDTITGEHSQQEAVQMILPNDYKDVLKASIKEEQKTADDFKHHLDHEGLRDEIMNIVKKNGYVPSEGVKHQYDFTKSFEEQVDDFKAGVFPVNDTLVVGGTPAIWQKIGFNALPVTINQTHVGYALNGTKDIDHHIGEKLLKDLPNAIQNPLAIIQSQSQDKSNRAVVILEMVHNGKKVIGAIEVDGHGRTNKIRIDSNSMATLFAKNNGLKQLGDAINNTINGSVELFYWQKNKARALLQRAGVQFSGGLPQDGFVHNITDVGSKVKPKYSSVTETQQFKRWFGDWTKNPKNASKVVNKDGTPRIVYHYTDSEFWEFDTSRSGSNQGKTHGDGIYISTSPTEFSYAGKNRMELYANIRKPFEMKLTRKQATYVLEKYASTKHDLDKYHGLYRNHAMEKLTSPIRVFDYLSEYAADNGIKVSDILKDLGYDGVHDGTEWVAFDSTQLKSATDNIGTFDGTNPDIRYQYKDSDGNELSAEQQEFFKDSKVRDENGNLLVVYHGTPDGGFTEFKLPKYLSVLMSAYGPGYYFTDKKNAEQYTKPVNKSVRSGAKSQLYKVYLNITNPLEIKWDTKQISRDSFKDIIRRGNDEWFRTNWMPFYADGSKSENQKLDFESLLEKYTDRVYRQSMNDGDILADLTRAFEGGNDAVLNAMKDVLGNDGVRFIDHRGDVWVAWSSEQIKNTDNKAPTSNPDIRYQYKDSDTYAPTFYSHMGKIIDDIKIAKMGAGGVVSYLKGKGVKNEEIKWSGIEDFLQGKKSVSKEELQEFVAGSQLEIAEDVRSESIDERIKLEKVNRKKLAVNVDGKTVDTFHKDKSGDWVSDSNPNYFHNEESAILRSYAHKYGLLSKWKVYALDGGSNYQEIVFKLPDSKHTNKAMQNHWGNNAEGILAHARIQDFDVNGKKMLFIEEIQSDWHNEGQKQGYKTKGAKSAQDIRNESADAYRDFYESDIMSSIEKRLEQNGIGNSPTLFANLIDGSQSAYNIIVENIGDLTSKEKAFIENAAKEERQRQDELKNAPSEKAAPDAPFKDNYQEYVLKRLLRMAAENGYDSLGWTTADIQSERWSDEYAEGYRIEYDQDIPKFLNKYGKKWNAKVGSTVLSNGKEVWSMDITDSMKNSVLYEGQPKYQYKDSEGNELSAEQQEFFKDSKVRDEEGRLLVLHRGSPEDFGTVFRFLEENLNSKDKPNTFGFFFTDSFDTAEYYSKARGNEGDIKTVYLNIKHPLDLTALGISSSEKEFYHLLEENGVITYRSRYKQDYKPVWTRFDKNGEELRRSIESAGFDGVVYHDWGEKKATYVAFSSEQIKNIDNKAPTSNPDIRYQYKDEDSLDSRNLLANALITTAKVGEERNLLRNYQSKINLINAEEQKLTEIRQKLFTKNAVDFEERKKLQHEAKAIATRINKYDKELLKLEAMSPLKKVLQKEKDLATKRQKQKDAEAMREYKEKVAKTQRELLNKWQDSREKAVEGRNRTATKHRIHKVVGELNTLLLKGTKDKHVPIGLQKPVADALAIINMDSVGAEERVAKYNALIAQANDPDVIASLTATRDNIQNMGNNMSAKLADLQNAYRDIANSDDPLIKNSYDEAIETLIYNTVKTVGNTSLRNMNLEQLEAVYDMYKAILSTVRNANKMFKAEKLESVQQNSESVKLEVRDVGGKTARIAEHMKAIKQFGWNELKPVYAMDLIGSKTFAELYNNVRKGEDTWAKDIEEAKKFFQAQAEKYGYWKWDLDKKYPFKDSAGNSFTLSLQQIMSLYAYSKRKQADRHLKEGGFVFGESIRVKEKNKLGIPISYEVNDATPYRLRPEDLAEMVKVLEEVKGARDFVDELQIYLSDVMGAKGNEVSLAMYDIKLYNEKYYFPLKSSKYFREFDPEKNGTPKIKNSSFSKKTVEYAQNPIVLDDFMSVWTNHVNDMSMYHSFVLPLEDFTRVYNYCSTAGGYDSVQQYIKDAYGSQAVQYIENLLSDLNGGITSDKVKSPLAGLVGKFKKTAVAMSWSVVVQQPTAVIRAMAMVDPKYFKPDLTMKLSEKWEQLKKYAPIAVIKEMGGFDSGGGRQADQYIVERKSLKDANYRDELMMKGAALADQIGWNSIWDACKREIQATTNLKGEELLKKAGERFTEVVVRTQVYDSTLSRSGFMRSQSDIVKMATAFMGEPTTSFNMMYGAVLQRKRGKISRGQSARIIGYTVASIVAAAAMKSLVSAGRDEDDDESLVEKYLQAFGGNLASDLFIPNMLPFVKDIVSIFGGWDVERTDMALIADLKDAIDGLSSDSKSTYRKMEDLIGTIGNFFGVPIKNVMRDFRGFINIFKGATDDVKPANAWESLWIEGVRGKDVTINSALDKGNTDRAKELIDDKIAGYIADGKTEKEAKSYVRSSLTSEYKDRYLEAYAKKDNDELIRIRKLLNSTGVYDNIVETCQNWVKDSKK